MYSVDDDITSLCPKPETNSIAMSAALTNRKLWLHYTHCSIVIVVYYKYLSYLNTLSRPTTLELHCL